MADGLIVLLGVVALAVSATTIAVVSHIVTEAGPRVFVWPNLSHGYEIRHATRIATAPWWLLLTILLTNAVAIMLFGQNVLGGTAEGWSGWLVAAIVPVLMAHLIDFRRSRIASCLSFLVVAGVTALAVWHTGWWVPALVGAPFVLWTFNGMRANISARMYG